MNKTQLGQTWRWVELMLTDAECHLSFHMDESTIAEPNHLLNNDLQNQISQQTCVISEVATDCVDSAPRKSVAEKPSAFPLLLLCWLL